MLPEQRRAAKQGGKAQKTVECIVGDETGTILFSARNEQGTSATSKEKEKNSRPS